MKKIEKLFETSFDRDIFIALFRSMKDARYKCPITDKTHIIKACYSSRAYHSGESLFTNISFWPIDLNSCAYKPNLTYSALFIARVINMDYFNEEALIGPCFSSNFKKYILEFNVKRKILMEEIVLAINKLSKVSPIYFKEGNFAEILELLNKRFNVKTNLPEGTLTPYQL